MRDLPNGPGGGLWNLVIGAAMGAAMGGVLLLAAAGPAAPHSFYSLDCCSGQDCAPVVQLRPTSSGWFVELDPGDHPTVRQPVRVYVPYTDPRIRPSPDGQFHACIGPVTQRVLCLYVPEVGA